MRQIRESNQKADNIKVDDQSFDCSHVTPRLYVRVKDSSTAQPEAPLQSLLVDAVTTSSTHIQTQVAYCGPDDQSDAIYQDYCLFAQATSLPSASNIHIDLIDDPTACSNEVSFEESSWNVARSPSLFGYDFDLIEGLDVIDDDNACSQDISSEESVWKVALSPLLLGPAFDFVEGAEVLATLLKAAIHDSNLGLEDDESPRATVD